jgi:hypothetical protein
VAVTTAQLGAETNVDVDPDELTFTVAVTDGRTSSVFRLLAATTGTLVETRMFRQKVGGTNSIFPFYFYNY